MEKSHDHIHWHYKSFWHGLIHIHNKNFHKLEIEEFLLTWKRASTKNPIAYIIIKAQ